MHTVKATPTELREARRWWAAHFEQIKASRARPKTAKHKSADRPPFREAVGDVPESSTNKLVQRLNRLRRLIEASEKRDEEVKRRAIGECCEWAVRLQQSKALWQGFIAEPRWLSAGGARPRRNHQPKALRFVLRWTFGLTGNVADTANFYHRAVAPLLAEGIPPEAVAAEIKRRGRLKKLAEAHAKPKIPKVIAERVEAESRSGPKRLAEAQAKAKMSKVVDQQAVNASARRKPNKDAVIALTIHAQLDAAGNKLLWLPIGAKAHLVGTVKAVGKVMDLTIHDGTEAKPQLMIAKAWTPCWRPCLVFISYSRIFSAHQDRP